MHFEIHLRVQYTKTKKLSNIEKFNYLKGKLTGAALNAIAGLSLSNENYEVAVSILQDRFRKKQDLVDILIIFK